MLQLLGLAIIAVAIYAVIRGVDVRLALLLAALALGTVARQPQAIVAAFVSTFSNEQFVIPLCSAMGFAHVLRHTGCDQHLVQLLVQPLRRLRFLLIPGTVVIGFVVNIPVISQTSTAVVIGAVLVPLLRAARISPVTTGAALLLGSSLGGELLNPGAPELRTITKALGTPEAPVDATECVARMFPLLLIHLGLATAVFWIVSARAEAGYQEPTETPPQDKEAAPPFRVNGLKAAVPLLPLTLLFLTALPQLRVFRVPDEWLFYPKVPAEAAQTYSSRLIGAAMLVGALVASLTSLRTAAGAARAFFEGAGYGFTHIISLIVAATCFGAGVTSVRLDEVVVGLLTAHSSLLLPAAGVLPLVFALLCGSGMAATQSLYELFIGPSRAAGIDPVHAGAVVSICAAAGRTMSPVAAVTLMTAGMTQTTPLDLVRRVALPLLLGVTAVIVAAILLA